MSSNDLPLVEPSDECRWSVVGLGVVVVDLLAVVEEYPRVDTKQDVSESRVQVGGPVPTALAQLTKFGRRCHFIGGWGDDPFGGVIEADLTDVGISHDVSCRQPGLVSGHSQIWIEAGRGSRTTVTQRPEEQRLSLCDADRDRLRNADVLHLDGWPPDLAFEAGEIAISGGAKVVVDTGSPKRGIERLLRLAHVVNAPRRFIEEFIGESDLARGAAAIAKLGPPVVTVTDGDRGAVMVADGRVLRADVRKPDRVVDTNGAGDVFTAGLIHGVLCDWSPEDILTFATTTASLKCGSLGNRESLPTLSQVMSAAGQDPK